MFLMYVDVSLKSSIFIVHSVNQYIQY